ncbi:hypothetical protein DITRI_Ditri15bG0069700 [Diplodiscus trichospermus]
MWSRSISQLLLFFFSCLFCLKNTFLVLGFHPNSTFFPVTKDAATLQYVARISHGNPLGATNLVVDLGGRVFGWIAIQGTCHRRTASSLAAQSTAPEQTFTILEARRLGMVASLRPTVIGGPNQNRCSLFLFLCTEILFTRVGLWCQGNVRPRESSNFTTVTAQPVFWAPSKVYSLFIVLQRCPINRQRSPHFQHRCNKSLVYTPLIIKQHSYFINVQSIKINGRRLAVGKSKLIGDKEGKLGTKLSTIVPYTTMESSIYAIFAKAYVKAAALMNMTRVEAVAPFGLCFSYNKKVENSMPVPEIDLILQSEMVKWRILGKNSMVKVSKDVKCLGLVDGGVEQSSPIVIGGLQLEDILFEFDLGTSMLGFSSSWLLKETTCSTLLQKSKLNQFI